MSAIVTTAPARAVLLVMIGPTISPTSASLRRTTPANGAVTRVLSSSRRARLEVRRGDLDAGLRGGARGGGAGRLGLGLLALLLADESGRLQLRPPHGAAPGLVGGDHRLLELGAGEGQVGLRPGDHGALVLVDQAGDDGLGRTASPSSTKTSARRPVVRAATEAWWRAST